MGMTDEKFAEAVRHGYRSRRLSITLAVFKHPKDYPAKYVARAFFVAPAGRVMASQDIFIVKNTLAEVRAAIPREMHRLNRAPQDDQQIVETYKAVVMKGETSYGKENE